MGVLSAIHVVAAFAMVGVAVAEARWITAKSKLLGAIFVAGLVARLITSVAAFAVSAFDVGILTGLHTGGGFWTLALDAQLYYGVAAEAAGRHPLAISWQAASPYYVTALAVWLAATGASVLNAIFFNAACYLVTAAAIVVDPMERSRTTTSEWTIVVLAAFSFSPVLLLSGTQVLKDPFFVMLVVVACRAAFVMFDVLRRWPAGRFLPLLPAIAVSATALAGIAGVRPYYAVFLWLAFAGGLVALVLVGQSAGLGRVKRAMIAAAVLATLGMSFVLGSGPYFRHYESVVARTGVFGQIQSSRAAFVRTGGTTNMATSAPTTAGDANASRLSRIARRLTAGLLATFVPMSILRAASIVRFSGGRGLLLIADLDTLFLDTTFLVIVAIAVRRRAFTAARLPAVCVALTLAAISAVLLAYVVTNFGTLLRLRLMVAAPAWMAAAALDAGVARVFVRSTERRPLMPPDDVLQARPLT